MLASDSLLTACGVVRTREYPNGSVVFLNPLLPAWVRTTTTGKWLFDQVRREPLRLNKLVADAAAHYQLPEKVIRPSIVDLFTRLREAGMVTGNHEAPKNGFRTAPVELREFWLEVTTACNLNCRHCYLPDHEPVFLDLFLARRAIEEALALGTKRLIFTGGEPLLHPELAAMFRHARQVQPDVYLKLITNGIVDDQAALQAVLPLVDDIQVSVEGISADTHDYLRGTGSFQRLLEVFRELYLARKNNGRLRVGLALTPNPRNLKQIATLQHLAYDVQADYIHLNRPHTPRGKGKAELVAEGFGTPALLRQALEEYTRLTAKTFSEYRDTRGFREVRQVVIDGSFDPAAVLLQPFGITTCGGGLFELCLKADGELYPCAALAAFKRCSAGSLEKENLGSLWSRAQAQRQELFSVERNDRCRTCDYRYFCGGGCRAVAGVDGDDPYCSVYQERYDTFFSSVSSIPGTIRQPGKGRD